jgi:2-polyprenyl-3-methyl-5-hydroxy-6-metoxy-1,4-benzoquinol methylase
LFECSDCGFDFANPVPSQEEISSFYSTNDKYDDWLSQESGRDLLWIRRLKILRKYVSNGALLDVGCGIGQFLHYAKNHFDVEGTEVSKSAVQIGKDKYGLNIRRGVLEELEFTKKYDVITLFHVLEHVQDPSRLVNSCRDLLKDNGLLLIAVPNELLSVSSVVKRTLKILGIGKFKYYGNKGIRKIALDGSMGEIHLSYFKPRVLEKFVKQSGFKILANDLDPYYASSGKQKLFDDCFFWACKVVKKVFGINIYSTILLATEKVS